jgi:hypothetical protein
MTTIQVQGISETIQYLNGVFQQLSNMQRGMQKAALVVTRSAKQNSPVDTGLLRASITPSVLSSGNVTTGVVVLDHTGHHWQHWRFGPGDTGQRLIW